MVVSNAQRGGKMRTAFLQASRDWMQLARALNRKSELSTESNCEQIIDEILAIQNKQFQARNVMNETVEQACKGLSKEDRQTVEEFVFCINKQAGEPKLPELYRKMVVLLSVESEVKPKPSRQQPEHPITKWVREHGHKYASNKAAVKAYADIHGGNETKLYSDLNNQRNRLKPKKPG